ncbi:hypothetical protein ACHAPU_003335 [Fusarium lateritium]
MDDLIAMASIVQKPHTRWLDVISRINSPENIARQDRLKQIDVELQDSVKFSREDTQGIVNMRPIRALFQEQERLEEEIARDTKLYEQELRDARAAMDAASQGIRLQSTPSAAQEYLQNLSIPTPSRSPRHSEGLQVQHSHEGGNEDDEGGGVDYYDPYNLLDVAPRDGRSESLSTPNDNRLQLVNSSPRESPRIAEEPSRSAKRARREPSPRLFIDFNEVFQQRDTLRPTQIVQYPFGYGHWYIFKCAIHQLEFSGVDAVHGAMTHLQEHHPDVSDVNLPTTVKELGVQVLNCSPDLAKRNNAVSTPSNPTPEHEQEKPNSQGPPPTRTHSRKKKKRGRPKAPVYSWKTPTSFADIHPSVMSPEPGDIVSVWVEKGKHFEPAMIIPWGRFDRLKYTRILAEVGLDQKIPKCYDGAQSDDTSPRPWAPGYEDGGDVAHRRMLPAIYFRETKDFPCECQSSWLALNKMKTFDKHCPYTIHKGAVLEYIDCHQTYHRELDQAQGPSYETKQVSAGEPEIKKEGEHGHGVWSLGRPVRRAQIVRSVEQPPPRRLVGERS